MNITFSKEEIAVLFTHLNLMKKSIKKGFKKTYLADWKDKFNHYVSLIDMLEVLIKDDDLDNEMFDVNQSVDQFTMLHSFINWYVAELNKRENNRDKLNHDTIKVLAVLEGIQMKINVLAVS